MQRPLTFGDYQRIVDRAWTHILQGGGVVPGDGSDLEDLIQEVADDRFGAKVARALFERLCDGPEPATKDEVVAAVWTLVSCYMDAAFVFGAVVQSQLSLTPPIKAIRLRPVPPKASRRSQDGRRRPASRHYASH